MRWSLSTKLCEAQTAKKEKKKEKKEDKKGSACFEFCNH
jgi:hypothetical protein